MTRASAAVPAVAGERARRLEVWRTHGASAAEADELVAYAESPLPSGPLAARRYPLPDGAWVEAWAAYAAEAERTGAEPVLRRVLVQLRFPIRAGIGDEPAYAAAVRRGQLPDEDDGPGAALVDPDGLRIFVHETPAGRVPVVSCAAREDFETLVRAITLRGEPAPVPASMGACTVSGYNDWQRVAALRRAWEEAHPEDWSGEGWAAEFRALLPRKELYQDRFLVLSSGPYSAVPARAMGLADDEWRRASLRLRLEHECAHYFTRQAFGSMRKSALDELVADYMGLVEARGRYRASEGLLFLGLERFPAYREGGRLQNYRGPLGDGAFRVLQAVVARAASRLEALDPSAAGPLSVEGKAEVMTALARVGLEGLASDDAPEAFAAALAEARAAGSASA